MIAQLSDGGVQWHEYVWLARLHRQLWGQMLLRALRHGRDAAAAGLPWLLPNQLPSEVSLLIRQQGIGVKLGLTRRAEGTLHATCGDKRPRILQSRSMLPVLFRRMWRVGGLRGSWQRQMAEQSVGHRMQLLHINRFLITIRTSASVSPEKQGWKLKFPCGLLKGLNTSLFKWETDRDLRLRKTSRS